MKKRLLSLALVACLVLTLIPAAAFAAGEFEVGGIYYEPVSGTDVKVIANPGGTLYSGAIVIPNTVTYGSYNYNVTEIGASAFDGCSGVTAVSLGNSITKIGNYAFQNCSSLKAITLPDGLKEIGTHAFQYSAITEIAVPNSVTTLGQAAFANMASLKKLKIGSGVTGWGQKLAVNNPELETVEIAEGAKLIGNIAFRSCPKLKNVTLPSTLETIGSTAFAYSAIETLTLPAGLKKIGADCFKDCDSLTDVTIPGAIPESGFGTTVFQMCDALETVNLPEGLTVIPQGTFRYCTALKNINFPDSLTTIGNYAFQGCTSLESVVISKNITSLVTNAFNGCTSLTSLTIEEGFSGTVGSYVFQGCTSLESVTLPGSMTKVAESMFNYCDNLKNVTLSEGIETLDISAFANCPSLETITLPASLKHIRHAAFANDMNLYALIVTGSTLPTVEYQNAFEGVSQYFTVYFDGSTQGTYFEGFDTLPKDRFQTADFAAQLNSTKYKTLEEAFAAAVTGDTFRLLKDVPDFDTYIPQGMYLIPNGDGSYRVSDTPAPTPSQPPVQSGSNYWVKYNGGNSFSTNKKDVPTSVEIDGMPVPFSGDGKNFTVSCVLSGAERITVRWNSTSVTTNFKPDASAFCGTVDIPKTGDMPFWAAVLALLGF